MIVDRCAVLSGAEQSIAERDESYLSYTESNKIFYFYKAFKRQTHLVAAGSVVHPRLEREYWALPRPRLEWLELILEDDCQSRY